MKLRSVLATSAVVAFSFVAVASAGVLAFLPENVQISRSAVISATPAQVYAQLNSSAGFHQINPFLVDHPDLKITRSGPEQGIGAVYAWQDKDEAGSQTIIKTVPNALVQMQLELGVQGRPLQTFVIEQDGSGTKVSWVMDASFGYNPIGRLIGQTLDSHLGPIYERGLGKLNTVVGAASANPVLASTLAK